MNREQYIEDVLGAVSAYSEDVCYIKDMLNALVDDCGMYQEVIDVSRQIKNGRDTNQVMLAAMEELGELALEVKIAQGKSHKPRGKDGIVGEAIDVCICMLDLIYVYDEKVSQEEINAIVTAKLAKWKDKANKPRSVEIKPFPFEDTTKWENPVCDVIDINYSGPGDQ